MSHDLEGLLEGGIGRARQLDGDWDGARAARIRGLALKTHSAQVRRTRAMGRVLVGGTSAACLVLALLRVASSAPSSASASPASVSAHVAADTELVASRALDDAGYTTD